MERRPAGPCARRSKPGRLGHRLARDRAFPQSGRLAGRVGGRDARRRDPQSRRARQALLLRHPPPRDRSRRRRGRLAGGQPHTQPRHRLRVLRPHHHRRDHAGVGRRVRPRWDRGQRRARARVGPEGGSFQGLLRRALLDVHALIVRCHAEHAVPARSDVVPGSHVHPDAVRRTRVLLLPGTPTPANSTSRSVSGCSWRRFLCSTERPGARRCRPRPSCSRRRKSDSSRSSATWQKQLGTPSPGSVVPLLAGGWTRCAKTPVPVRPTLRASRTAASGRPHRSPRGARSGSRPRTSRRTPAARGRPGHRRRRASAP